MACSRRRSDRRHCACVCFVAGDHVLLAESDRAFGAMAGVPRLRLHRDAPSRSALKLEERCWSCSTRRSDASTCAGMRAADLGAAPGGWTWVLVRHGHTAAIDNGPLRPHLFDSDWSAPARRRLPLAAAAMLDWMVCDMVEQPSRVARRMGWLREG